MSKLHSSYTFSVGQTLDLNMHYWMKKSDSSFMIADQSNIITIVDQDRGGIQWLYRAEMGRNRFALALEHDRFIIHKHSRGVDNSSTAEPLFVTQPSQGKKREITSIAVEGRTYLGDERWQAVYGSRIDDYSDFGNHWSPHVAILYHPNPLTAYKLVYGHAFRAPAAFEQFGTTGFTTGNRQLDVETLDSIELVWLKHQGHWRSQWVIFWSSWKDAIKLVLDPDSPTPSGQFKADDSHRSKGITYERQWHRSPWTVSFSSSYAKGENRTNGEEHMLFPNYKLSLDIGYYIPLYRLQIHLNQRLLADMEDVDREVVGFEPQSLPTYWRTDLLLSRQFDEQLEAWINIRNMFDRELLLPSPSGSRGGIPGEAVNLSIGARFIF